MGRLFWKEVKERAGQRISSWLAPGQKGRESYDLLWGKVLIFIAFTGWVWEEMGIGKEKEGHSRVREAVCYRLSVPTRRRITCADFIS